MNFSSINVHQTYKHLSRKRKWNITLLFLYTLFPSLRNLLQNSYKTSIKTSATLKTFNGSMEIQCLSFKKHKVHLLQPLIGLAKDWKWLIFITFSKLYKQCFTVGCVIHLLRDLLTRSLHLLVPNVGSKRNLALQVTV